MREGTNTNLSINEDCSAQAIPGTIRTSSMSRLALNRTRVTREYQTCESKLDSSQHSDSHSTPKPEPTKQLSKFFLKSRSPTFKASSNPDTQNPQQSDFNPQDTSFESKAYFGLLKRNMGVFSRLKQIPSVRSISFGRPVQRADSATKKYTLPKFSTSTIKIRKVRSDENPERNFQLSQTGNRKVVDKLLSNLEITLVTPDFAGVPQEGSDSQCSGRFADLCELSALHESEVKASAVVKREKGSEGGSIQRKESFKRANCSPESLKRFGIPASKFKHMTNFEHLIADTIKENALKKETPVVKKNFQSINKCMIYLSDK